MLTVEEGVFVVNTGVVGCNPKEVHKGMQRKLEVMNDLDEWK